MNEELREALEAALLEVGERKLIAILRAIVNGDEAIREVLDLIDRMGVLWVTDMLDLIKSMTLVEVR